MQFQSVTIAIETLANMMNCLTRQSCTFKVSNQFFSTSCFVGLKRGLATKASGSPSSGVRTVPRVTWEFMWRQSFQLAKPKEILLKVKKCMVVTHLFKVILVPVWNMTYMTLGDEIFSINGISVQGMTHDEAIGLFKEVKRGPVVVKIGRSTTSKKIFKLEPAKTDQF